MDRATDLHADCMRAFNWGSGSGRKGYLQCRHDDANISDAESRGRTVKLDRDDRYELLNTHVVPSVRCWEDIGVRGQVWGTAQDVEREAFL